MTSSKWYILKGKAMTKKEWYIINEPSPYVPVLFADYQDAVEASRGFPVTQLVVNESWVEPEREWGTPIDSEATTRPMVEVRQSEHEPWRPAILLAVRQQAIRSYPPGPESVKYIAIESSTDQLWWNHCRIHKHEVELIYGSRKDKR